MNSFPPRYSPRNLEKMQYPYRMERTHNTPYGGGSQRLNGPIALSGRCLGPIRCMHQTWFTSDLGLLPDLQTPIWISMGKVAYAHMFQSGGKKGETPPHSVKKF